MTKRIRGAEMREFLEVRLTVESLRAKHVPRSTTISKVDADLISEKFSTTFDLSPVRIHWSARAKTAAYGRYYSRKRMIRLYPKAKGNNLETLLHELSHHMQRTINPSSPDHGTEFYQSFGETLSWWFQGVEKER